MWIRRGKEFNENWKVLIIVLLTLVIIGFAAVTFALWKPYMHIEKLYEDAMETIRLRTDEAKFRMVERADMMRENGGDERQSGLLRDCARRAHGGLVLNGGFVERNTKHSN